MNVLVRIALAFMVFTAVFIACLLVSSVYLMPNSLVTPTTLFTLVGGAFALFAFLFNLERARSQDVLSAATSTLQKAYESISPAEGETLPNNSRLAWLSCARLLRIAELLGGKLTEPSHKEIYAVERHFWRSKFYDLVYPDHPEGLPSTFYSLEPSHMIAYGGKVERAPLSEKSLKYVYDFIRWREDEADPLADVAIYSDEEIERMEIMGPRGLGNLLRQVRKLHAK